MTEREWTNSLLTALDRMDWLRSDPAELGEGWIVSHDPDSRGQVPGEPDLRFLWIGGRCPGPHRAFTAELKAIRGRLSDAQRRTLNALAAAGQVAYLWVVPADNDLAEAALGLPAGALGGAVPVPAGAVSVCGIALTGLTPEQGQQLALWATEAKLSDWPETGRRRVLEAEVARLKRAQGEVLNATV